MNKQFTVGIIVMFFVLSFTPMTLGYNISNKETSESTTSHDGGLMNSSWPMFGQNTRHTGRSPFGKSGTWYVEKWNVGIGKYTYSSPAIDENGTIYIGSNDRHLYAINSDGTEKWRYLTGGGVSSSPAISEDGTIYVGSNDGKLYAFYPNGTKKWNLRIGSSWVSPSPVIDDDGIIYIASAGDNNICAVYPNGTKKWNYVTGDSVHTSPVLDNMGNIYCGSNDGYMHALYTSNGTRKWRYGTGAWVGGDGATVGDDGTIYFGDTLGYVHAVNPNGTRKWRKDLLHNVVVSPAITEEGNIIVGNYDGYVYSLTPDNAAENWRFYVEEWEDIPCSPAIDKFGIIYFGANNGWFYALNPDGILRWSFKALDEFFTSPAIGEDGTIYVGSHGQLSAKLYALEPVEGNSPPEVPNIDGPKNVNLIFKFAYTFDTTDPDGDDVSFFVQWDGRDSSGWTEYVPSGTSIELKHRFYLSGLDYAVMKVKAKDEHGAWSDWARYRVNFGFSRNLEINSLFLQFLERFSLLNYFRNILKG